jgi:hypothetical protein
MNTHFLLLGYRQTSVSFPCFCIWGPHSGGYRTWGRTVRWKRTDVEEEWTAFIFRTGMKHTASVWSTFVSYLAYFFDHEDGGDMFFRNVRRLSLYSLYQRMNTWSHIWSAIPSEIAEGICLHGQPCSIDHWILSNMDGYTAVYTFADLTGQHWMTTVSHRYAITLFWFRINLTVAVAVLKCM